MPTRMQKENNLKRTPLSGFMNVSIRTPNSKVHKHHRQGE